MMDYSENYVNLCKELEGCSLVGYADAAGVPTDGYGHTGPEVKVGREITQEQADANFAADSDAHCAALNRRMDLLGITLSQDQFDAVLSMVYNLGVDEVLPEYKQDRPTTFCGALCAGNYAKAAEYMLTFNKITKNGQKVECRGLTKRRQKEQALFLKGA